MDSERLTKTLNLAVKMREESRCSPRLGDDLASLHEKLIAARAEQDVLDEVLVSAMTLRHQAKLEADEAASAAEDAWNESAVGRGVGAEFISGRERNATHSVQTITQQVSARRAQRELDRANLVLDVVRLIHSRLSGVRRDIELLIRSQHMLTQLER